MLIFGFCFENLMAFTFIVLSDWDILQDLACFPHSSLRLDVSVSGRLFFNTV